MSHAPLEIKTDERKYLTQRFTMTTRMRTGMMLAATHSGSEDLLRLSALGHDWPAHPRLHPTNRCKLCTRAAKAGNGCRMRGCGIVAGFQIYRSILHQGWMSLGHCGVQVRPAAYSQLQISSGGLGKAK